MAWTLTDVCRAVTTSNCQVRLFPLRWHKATLCLLVSALVLKMSVLFVLFLVPYFGFCFVLFFTYLCFSWVISLFGIAPKRSAAVLARVPKCEKAVTWRAAGTHIS